MLNDNIVYEWEFLLWLTLVQEWGDGITGVIIVTITIVRKISSYQVSPPFNINYEAWWENKLYIQRQFPS